jgi:hypothetical protein
MTFANDCYVNGQFLPAGTAFKCDSLATMKDPVKVVPCAPSEMGTTFPDGMTAEDDKQFNRQWDVGATHPSQPAAEGTPRCDEAENKEAWRDPNQWVTELSVAWELARTLERELAEAKDAARFDAIRTKAAEAAVAGLSDLLKKEGAALAAAARDAELWKVRAEQLSFMADGETAERYWAKIDALIERNKGATQESAGKVS